MNKTGDTARGITKTEQKGRKTKILLPEIKDNKYHTLPISLAFNIGAHFLIKQPHSTRLFTHKGDNINN